jgi:hypothetical protein
MRKDAHWDVAEYFASLIYKAVGFVKPFEEFKKLLRAEEDVMETMSSL